MSEPTSITLLPCPSCGSPAVLRSYRGIQCSNLACWWEVDFSDYGCASDAELASQWNTRATASDSAHLLDAARAVVAHLDAINPRGPLAGLWADLARLRGVVRALAFSPARGACIQGDNSAVKKRGEA